MTDKSIELAFETWSNTSFTLDPPPLEKVVIGGKTFQFVAPKLGYIMGKKIECLILDDLNPPPVLEPGSDFVESPAGLLVPPQPLPKFDGFASMLDAISMSPGPWQPDIMFSLFKARRNPVVVGLGQLVPGFAEMRATSPCSETPVLCCCGCGQPVCPKEGTLPAIIAHLNDRHAWTREAVADWLDTLDLDLTVNIEKENNECPSTPLPEGDKLSDVMTPMPFAAIAMKYLHPGPPMSKKLSMLPPLY